MSFRNVSECSRLDWFFGDFGEMGEPEVGREPVTSNVISRGNRERLVRNKNLIDCNESFLRQTTFASRIVAKTAVVRFNILVIINDDDNNVGW